MKIHIALPGQKDGNFYNELSCSKYSWNAGLVTTDLAKVTCKRCNPALVNVPVKKQQ